jgi:hypothetical protein
MYETCIPCEPINIKKCPHGKQKTTCKECGGSQICIHGRNKSICKECGGSQICIHGRNKSICKECGGSKICIHGKQKTICKECGGSQICIHGRCKSTCTECPIQGNISRRICKGCLSKTLSSKRIEKGLCASCDKSLPERTEITFGKLIIDYVGFEPNLKDKVIATGSNCEGLDKRRPDLLWFIEGKVAVVVEIDEHSHIGYEPSCEVRKISEQNLAIQQVEGCENIPVFTIRVNPDAYDVKTVHKKTRAKIVAEKVKELLNGDYERNGYAKIFFCCYHSDSKHLIDEQMKHWDCEMI